MKKEIEDLVAKAEVAEQVAEVIAKDKAAEELERLNQLWNERLAEIRQLLPKVAQEYLTLGLNEHEPEKVRHGLRHQFLLKVPGLAPILVSAWFLAEQFQDGKWYLGNNNGYFAYEPAYSIPNALRFSGGDDGECPSWDLAFYQLRTDDLGEALLGAKRAQITFDKFQEDYQQELQRLVYTIPPGPEKDEDDDALEPDFLAQFIQIIRDVVTEVLEEKKLI